MKKKTKYLYAGLLSISFLISSPLMVSMTLKSSPDAKVSKAYARYEETAETSPESTETTESMQDTAITETSETLSAEPETEPETEADTRERTKAGLVLVESNKNYFDDALFIGDSRMTDIRDYGTLDNAGYLCSVGLSTYKVTNGKEVDGETLADKFDQRDYSKIYIMLGLNECADGPENYRINMTELLDEVRSYAPDALIYLMANLHVSRQACLDTPSENNERLNAINQAMEEMTDGKTIIYLDVNPLFDTEDGCLPDDISGDGVHPYADYFPEWCDWICQHTITAESEQVSGQPSDTIDFGQAVEELKQGNCIARKNWDSETWIFLDENEEFQIRTSDDTITSWEATQEDMLAEDWVTVSGSGDI